MAEAAVTDETGDVICQCICKINKKDYSLIVTKSNLRWHVAGNKGQKDLHNVRIGDVLSANLESSSKHVTDKDSVKVSYVKQEKKLHLKLCSMVITSTDLQLVAKLHQQISDLLRNVQQRPKKLLVLINPVSGRSRGRTVYAQKVAPIFQVAGIETDVIVTEKAHHTEEILLAYDIKTLDGLVVVGGDGLYHEAANGLMQKLTKEQGINTDDPDISVPELHLMIGLIPCGTGNGVAYASYGNYDVVTAALSIAIGHQMESNMISVHSGGKLVAYSTLLVGYGTWGDVIYTAETRRDQGVLRYPIAIFQHMFIKPLRRMNLTIQSVEYEKPSDKDSTENKKEADKENATKADDNNVEGSDAEKNEEHLSGTSLKTTNENAIGAIIFLLDLPDTMSANKPDLSQSVMYLNKSPLRRKFFTFMMDLMMLKFERFERREDIGLLPGKEWTVKLNEPSQVDTENGQLEHMMNIDGEIFKLPQPEYRAKLLSKNIKLFSNLPYYTKRECTL